jgi:seryl-tRNA synthetase
MLDIKFIRENPDKVKDAVATRGYKVDIEKLLKLDEEKRELMKKVEDIKSQKKKLGKDDRDQAGKLKDEEKNIEKMLSEKNEHLDMMMLDIPNIPLDSVPIGKDESENKVLRTVGDKPKFSFEPRDHVELGEMLDIIDIERAGKVSGSRFAYIKNEGVLLQFAMVRWIMDKLIEKGFSPMLPPAMVKRDTMNAMGFLQHGGDDETYHFEKDDLYLIGTSEQSGMPYHMDEILDGDELPKKYVCYSTCFRREAGSYGKDTKGILRLHQFDKLEMLVITKPEWSEKHLEELVGIEEEIMQDLKLPYQVVQLCTGDLNDPGAASFDIEAWMPAQNQYRETHSASTTTDFQARRLNMRYKAGDKKNIFCHTLNATAITNRALIAILENFQQKDGSVEIPKVLRPYMNKIKKIEPKQ